MNQIKILIIAQMVLFLFVGQQPAMSQQNNEEKAEVSGLNPAVQALFKSPKIIRPEQVLKDFVSGEPKTRVFVNLHKPSHINQLRDIKDVGIRQQLRQAVKQAQDQIIPILNDSDVRITYRFKYIFGFSAEVSLQGLQDLIEHANVLSIEKREILQPHLAQGIPLINATTVRNTYNGSGMAIAICDTGIDYTHPMLGNGDFGNPDSKVIGGYDTGEDDPNPMDEQGHGTACAGIAAGDLSTSGDYIGGVAYNARLYALKITRADLDHEADPEDMIEAWEWCVDHQNDHPSNPIMIVSTSFGGGYHTSSCDDFSLSMTEAALNLNALDITIFASSGNDGYCDGTAWPACISHVNAVGAVYDADLGINPPPEFVGCIANASCVGIPGPPCDEKYYVDDPADENQVPTYSNTASFLDLLAPSEWATTTEMGGGYWDTANGFGGTSAACPYTAGAAACLQSAAMLINGSYLTPSEVKSKLTSTGDLITDTKVSITKPMINLTAAIGSLSELPNFDAPFNASYSGEVTWYSLNLLAGQGITVVLDSHLTSGYLDFGLFDIYGNEIAGSDDSNIYDGENGKFSKIVTVSGVYYIKVWGSSDAAGNYDLAVYNAWFNAGVTDSQRNFYSTKYTSRYLQGGDYGVSPLREEWYRFTAQRDAQIDVVLTAHLNLGWLDYGIYDENGNEIAGTGYSEIYDGQTWTLSKTIMETGVYYVKVWGSSDAVGYYNMSISGAESNEDTDGDSLFDAAEYYHGTDVTIPDTDGDGTTDSDELAQGRNPDIATEYTSGDVAGAVSQATAVPVPLFDEPFCVEHPGTETWYSMNLVSGQGIDVVLTAHVNRGWLDYGIYDESGNEIADTGYSEIYDGQTWIFSRTVSETEVYYIKVWGSSDAAGTYDLAVHNAWFNAGVTDSQRDFYSTKYTSRYLQGGDYGVSPLREEWYRFTAQRDAQIDVVLTAHLNLGWLDYGIYDENGNEIAGTGYSEIYDGQTWTLSKTIMETGVYYVKVWGSSDAVGYYNMSISGAESNEDTDGDSLFDAAEYYHGTDVTIPDTDGDGTTDSDELAQGRNPDIATEYTSGDVAGAVSQATAVPVPLFDEPFCVEHPGTETWYSMNLVSGQGIDVVLTAHVNRGWLDYGIYDESGNEIADTGYSEIYDGQTWIFSRTVSETEVYYIKVWGSSDAAGTYDLAVHNAWFNAGVTDSQRDFYSTKYTSRYLQGGDYGVSPLREEWYRFTAQRDAQIDVVLTAHLNLGWLDYGIYDENGNEIAGTGYSEIYDGQTWTLSKTIMETGVYYVKVWGSSDAVGYYNMSISGAESNEDTDGDSLFDAAEYYHGTDVTIPDTDGDGTTDSDELAQGRNPDIATEYTSGDVAGAVSQATAVPVPLFDEPFCVEHPGTETWYSMNLVSGQGIDVVLTAHVNRGWLDYGIYDESGNEIADTGYSEIYDGQTWIFSRIVNESGVYYIKVWGSSDTAGNYDLAVYNAWFNAGVTDSQRNFYSTKYTSRYLQGGDYGVSPLREEWYRFTAQRDAQIDVVLTAHLNLGWLDYGIYDENGNEIAGTGYSEIYDGQTWTLSKTIMEAGVYYVKVWGSSDAVGYYDLSISGHDPIATIHIDPVSHNFGDVNVGNQPQQLFTVSNTGELDLVIGDLSITGDPEFIIQSDGCSQNTLSQFETSTFAVVFSPSSEGEKSTIVSIPSNDSGRPTLNVLLSGKGVAVIVDSDNDGLSDDLENTTCTDPFDADTDDDGISDGVEDANHNGVVDYGETDPCDIDTDDDGIQDGTELGYTLADIGPDTDTDIFQPDLDPSTTTDPLNSDTDGDGLSDGQEDTNHDGAVNNGEKDPAQKDNTFGPDSADITNPFFPINTVKKLIYAGYGALDGYERYMEVVGTEVIDNVNCAKVVIKGYGNNPDPELDPEWYYSWVAQDTDEVVWVLQRYMAEEDTTEFFGKGNAVVLMPSNPVIGQTYNHIESEYSQITDTGVTVPELNTGLGPYTNCIKTMWTDGISDVDFEYHAPDVGPVKLEWDGITKGWELKEIIYYSSTKDELAIDFKTTGIYVYNTGIWNRIYQGVDPEGLCSFGTYLAADFGTTYGLYVYDVGAWTRVYKGVAIEKMAGFGGKLAVDFGTTYPLYEYDFATDTWSLIYKYGSPRDTIEALGDKLVVDFKTAGIYVYDAGIWNRIYRGVDPVNIVTFGDKLAIDFGTAYGLYVYEYDTDNWTRVYKGVAIEKMAEIDGDLAVNFGTAYGLYVYEFDTDNWTRVYKGVAIEKMAGFDGNLAIDFGTTYPIYEYDFNSDNWNSIYKYSSPRDALVPANILD